MAAPPWSPCSPASASYSASTCILTSRPGAPAADGRSPLPPDPTIQASVDDALTARLIEQMDRGEIGLQIDPVARLELMAFTEHRQKLALAQPGRHQGLSTSRLDHPDFGLQAAGLGAG